MATDHCQSPTISLVFKRLKLGKIAVGTTQHALKSAMQKIKDRSFDPYDVPLDMTWYSGSL